MSNHHRTLDHPHIETVEEEVRRFLEDCEKNYVKSQEIASKTDNRINQVTRVMKRFSDEGYITQWSSGKPYTYRVPQ